MAKSRKLKLLWILMLSLGYLLFSRHEMCFAGYDNPSEEFQENLDDDDDFPFKI